MNIYLPIDTKFFKDTEAEILSQFDNIDKSLDGWLIKSENYQALNTILPKFRGKVQCIYIDPPYNTKSTPIAYMNNYNNSTWLTMMENRLQLSKEFLKENGLNITSIDDIELRHLVMLLDDVFKRKNYITVIATEANPSGRVADKITKTSEYHIVHAKNIDTIGKIFVKRMENLKSIPLKRAGMNSDRNENPNRYYPILVKDGKVYMISKDEYMQIYDRKKKVFNDDFIEQLREKYTKEGYDFILPVKKGGKKVVWNRTFDRVLAEKDTYTVRNGSIYTPVFDVDIPKTLWKHPLYSNPYYGSRYLKEMLGKCEFETPKSYHTIMQLLRMSGNDGICMDYFGGSGTTAHAVIELNREENSRKFLIIEMGDYFYTTLIPRLKKLCISNKWKDAKPKNSEGVSLFFKYYELEQYEEVLDMCEYKNGKIAYSVKNLNSLGKNIDIPETLSNLTGKWIKKIENSNIWFEGDTEPINITNIDFNTIKPLVSW